MSVTETRSGITVSLADLEKMIRRTVHEAVREEVSRLMGDSARLLSEYERHEGPDDEAEDAQLLQEALVTIQQYRENPAGWKSLEEFKSELAEGEHELQS